MKTKKYCSEDCIYLDEKKCLLFDKILWQRLNLTISIDTEEVSKYKRCDECLEIKVQK